ncbi:unnamed protein product [Blumeria hordei]|uniref:Dephospho-CoA kinase n=1 Tax=Blumeria hordei TaxID=2867405 RepID=A0A383V393_BLUHO|nr:unnamed protein product [Blumeria hordei]
MLILGLTGGIATGKSTVSSILSQPPYSLPIIDADKLARRVVEPGTPAYLKIVEKFSTTTPDLLQPASTSTSNDTNRGAPLNRYALGQRVFGDSEERRKDRAVLNSIVHPAVRKEIFRQVLLSYLKGHWAVVLDVPLLFESGLDLFCGTVIMVAVTDAELQIERLMKRDDHLSRTEAQDRVLSQGKMGEKVQKCLLRGNERGIVIWNDADLDELRESIGAAMTSVVRGSPKWWARCLLICPLLGVVVGLWNYWLGLRISRKQKSS